MTNAIISTDSPIINSHSMAPGFGASKIDLILVGFCVGKDMRGGVEPFTSGVQKLYALVQKGA